MTRAMQSAVELENALEGQMWLPGGSLRWELMQIEQRSTTERTSMMGQSSHIDMSHRGTGTVEGA